MHTAAILHADAFPAHSLDDGLVPALSPHFNNFA